MDELKQKELHPEDIVYSNVEVSIPSIDNCVLTKQKEEAKTNLPQKPQLDAYVVKEETKNKPITQPLNVVQHPLHFEVIMPKQFLFPSIKNKAEMQQFCSVQSVPEYFVEQKAKQIG